MTRFSGNLLAAVILLAGRQSLLAADAATPQAAPRVERLREFSRLWNEAYQLGDAGKLDEAIATIDKLLPIQHELSPKPDNDLVKILRYLGTLQMKREDFASARKARQEVLRITAQHFGQRHWMTEDARQELADVDLFAKLTKDEREALESADRSSRRARQLMVDGKYSEGIKLTAQALDIRKRLLGPQHPDYVASLGQLGVLHKLKGDFAHAEPLYRQVLEIDEKTIGPRHPDYAIVLHSLANLYISKGDYPRAEPLYKQALAITKNTRGERHPNYATLLSDLALLYKSMGDYARAEPICKQALAVRKETLGEKDPDYAMTLNNLAAIYELMGDFARAEPLYQQALSIRKSALGASHHDYGSSLNNLAILYSKMGSYARAESLYEQALAIKKTALGEHHPDYAATLHNLAILSEMKGDYARAEARYKQVLEIDGQILGVQHPDYAMSLTNLANLYLWQQKYSSAEPLFKQALDIKKKSLGEQHPDYARGLNSLAIMYAASGDYAQAEPLALSAMHVVRSGVELTAAIQSENQQLAMNKWGRLYLDNYLTIAGDGKFPPEQAYAEVLMWKGAVSARQSAIRRLRDAADRPEVAQLFNRLEKAGREFAAQSPVVPLPAEREAHRRRLEDLSAQIESLERQLAGASAEFRRQLAQRRRGVPEVAAALPSDVALVDLLEYGHVFMPSQRKPGTPKSEWRIVAFVVRRDRPVVRVDLGRAGPIRRAIADWRRQFVPGSEGPATKGASARRSADPAGAMRALVWEKLAPHVGGAATLLISPDAALARFPWPALQTNPSGRYLIEDKAIAIVPIPQLLPELLTGGGERDPHPSLLLVGDVDYQAAAGAPTALAQARSAARGGSAGHFEELPNTRQEIVTVRDSFEQRFPDGEVKALRKSLPTEERVREVAGKYQYLHLATHGFFAPAALRCALTAASRSSDAPATETVTRQDLAGVHPGLLSGIVLAGANGEVVSCRDDGILTALEVAQLDLSHVKLATLSACETGLGETAGGEGLLGLQCAFQTAGARSVLASLWKVDDDAARQLMIEFYDNLWTRNMSKAEALRQAQLTLLREGLKRGLKVIDDDSVAKKDNRLTPDHWAAFVLSGDWR